MRLNLHHNSVRRPQDTMWHRIANEPYLDWLIMVIVAASIALVLMVISFFVYRGTKIKLETSGDLVTQDHRNLFDSVELDRVLHEFVIRADEQASLVKGYVGVADPSL